ncbi:MAG: hypothetical protein GY822_06255 [Deltaproteobacteria bacterium]|nr:hypothetical protein [Deltaproteobacteria bacterium]
MGTALLGATLFVFWAASSFLFFSGAGADSLVLCFASAFGFWAFFSDAFVLSCGPRFGAGAFLASLLALLGSFAFFSACFAAGGVPSCAKALLQIPRTTRLSARLKGARLKGARLKGARLKGARLKGARLKGAKLKAKKRMALPTERGSNLLQKGRGQHKKKPATLDRLSFRSSA